MHKQQGRSSANNLSTLTFLCENIVRRPAWSSFLSPSTSYPVWSVCGVCLSCHSSSVVKTRLNSGWLSQRGQVQLCVYDPVGVRVKLNCVCLRGQRRDKRLPGCADGTDCLLKHFRNGSARASYYIRSFLLWRHLIIYIKKKGHSLLRALHLCDPERACVTER